MRFTSRQLVLLLTLFVPLPVFAQAAATQKGREMPVTTSSAEARAFFQQGRDHYDNSEAALAIPLFDKAIAADGKFALAHAYRGTSDFGLDSNRKFVDRAVELAGGASDGERLWIQWARAQVDGNDAGQIAANDALLALYPDDKRVQLKVGNRLLGVGDAARSTGYFERALAIDPDFAAAHNQLGYARMALGDLAGAEKALRRAAELRPKSPNAHDSLAELLLKMGRFDDSIASYRKALELDPSFSSAWAGIGHGHLFRGRHAEAREAYAKSVAVSTDLAGKLWGRVWRAVSYVDEGRPGAAIAAFDELRTFADENGSPVVSAWTHLHSAWILIEVDAVGAAAKQLDAAVARAADPALPAPVRAGLEVAIQRLRVMSLGKIHAFDEARALAQKNAAAAAAQKDVAAQRWLAGVMAFTELEAGKPDAALEQASKAVRDSPWTLYQEALAHQRKGETAEAQKEFARVAQWNQADLGYALVRAKAMAKVGGAP